MLIEHNNNITGIDFKITSTKLYVINDNIIFLEELKQVFKENISCNKYRTEITKQCKNNNLDYLINLTLRNINRSFVLSFSAD